MREIKYRVWAKVNECYLDMEAGYFYLAPDGTFYEITQLRNGEIDYNEVRADVQFYTGLKDKNGKEIYEGDLVKAKTVMESMPIWIGEVMRECDFYGIDVNQDTGWVIVDKKLNSCIAFYPEQDREIIGNIFENPELLK